MNYLRNNVGSAKRLSVNSRIKGLRTLLFGLFFVFAVAIGVQRTTIGDAKLALLAAANTPSATNLTAVAQSTSAILLQWQGNASSGFKIQRSLGSTCTNFSYITTVSTTSFTNTGLSQGTTYCYQVIAIGNGGKQSASNTASATTFAASLTATPTPTPTPTPSSGSWTFCANETQQCNFGGTAQVRYGADGGVYTYGTFTNGVSCSNTIFGDPDPGVAKHCDYGSSTSTPTPTPTPTPASWIFCANETQQCNFGGTAQVRYGANGYYNYGTFTNGVLCSNTIFGDPAPGVAKHCDDASTTSTPTPTPTPAAPSNLVATAVSTTQINLTWIDNSSNESGFRIDRALVSTGPWTQVGDLATNVTSWGNSALSANTLYYYRVYAYNTAGNSGYSNVASTTTQSLTAPSAPTANAATNVTSSSFTANWSSSSGATGYRLDVSASSTFGTFMSGYQDRDVGNVLSFGVSGLSAGTTYYYRVRAYSTGGTSANSNVASAITVAAPTPTPTPTPSSGPWSKGFGSTTNDAGQAVAFDSSGNMYATGYFQGTVNFGCGALTSNNSSYSDAFLTKYSSTGVCVWSKNFGGTFDDAGYGVAVDANNNVVVAGYFSGTANFGRESVTGQPGYNIFVAKYGSDGSYQWANTFGSPDGGSNYAYAVAVDSGGNVAITGQFQNTIDFGGGSLTANGFVANIFVVKLSAAGVHQWSKALTGDDYSSGQGIGFDYNGNVVVTGSFESSVNFGCKSLTSTGGYDIFVAKYSSTGACLWANSYSNIANAFAVAVAVDFAGNIILTGNFLGTIDFGGGSLTASVTYPDIYVAKLSPSGGHVWSKRFGSTSSDKGLGVAVDSSGNVVMTGYFIGTVDFGGGGLTSVGLTVYVAKFSSGGSYLWSRAFAGTTSNLGNGVAADPNGNIGVTGNFQGSVDFGQGTLTSAGGLEGYAIKLGP